jgi:hypothetical protein
MVDRLKLKKRLECRGDRRSFLEIKIFVCKKISQSETHFKIIVLIKAIQNFAVQGNAKF